MMLTKERVDESVVTAHQNVLDYILSVNPSEVGLRMDMNGWVNVLELLMGVNRFKFNLSFEDLQYFVNDVFPDRYEFNEDSSLIRAKKRNQEFFDSLELTPITPPAVLYHGTAQRFFFPIMKEGILNKNGEFVYLSTSHITAVNCGMKHTLSPNEKSFLLEIDAAKMVEDGFIFYKVSERTWLVNRVPACYITKTIEFNRMDHTELSTM